MLKEPIKSAGINPDPRESNFSIDSFGKAHAAATRGIRVLRLWISYGILAHLFLIKYAS